MTPANDAWAWLSDDKAKTVEDITGADDVELTRSFTRTFLGRDGIRVMAHLRSITKERALGPEVPASVLRYLEGQRSLVAYIERLILRGRS